MYWIEGPKTAKRKLRCRSCGREIPKGAIYYVERDRDGPYVRRRVLCPECARRAFLFDLEERVRGWRWRAIEECKYHTDLGLSAIEAAAISVLAPGVIEKKKTEICMKKIDESGFYVYLGKYYAELAKSLGIDLEKEVRKIHPKATVKIKGGE